MESILWGFYFILVLRWKYTFGDESGSSSETGSSPTILGISSPPVIVTGSGEIVYLKCIYNGEPEPKVNWLKKGKEVRHDCPTCIITIRHDLQMKSSFFNVTPFEQDDFGEYECRVRNQYGSAKLKVQVKKSDIVLTKCQKERITAKDPRKKKEFLPICNEDGSYHEVQCSIQHDTCWCVNKHGKKTLDVIDGANGLRCFSPKDLSGVAIYVFAQGILLMLFMVDQFIDLFTGRSVTKYVKTHLVYYKDRAFAAKKGYRKLEQDKKGTEKKIRKISSVVGTE